MDNDPKWRFKFSSNSTKLGSVGQELIDPNGKLLATVSLCANPSRSQLVIFSGLNRHTSTHKSLNDAIMACNTYWGVN